MIVLQPNIRLVGPRYWDFIDHRVALTERSLLEAAELAGLRTDDAGHAVPAVLHEGSAARRAVRWSGRTSPSRPAWWLLGKQTLYVGVQA